MISVFSMPNPDNSVKVSVSLISALLISIPVCTPEDIKIQMGVASGLKFDPPRFHVTPGSRVSIEFFNSDQMMHNMVITVPGARLRVLSSSMQMGEAADQKHYVPDSAEVLWSFPVLKPDSKEILSFQAPEKEGVYPYLCTIPGHGYQMYGAMYVSTNGKMPPLDKDPHLPPYYRQSSKNYHAYPPKLPTMYRIFMPDSGPASIAVALPGDTSYCWDAGACRLRYIWKGGFIKVMPHMAGNGNHFAGIVGRIFCREHKIPLSFDETGKTPATKFLGYRLVDGGYPEFNYRIGDIEVRELIKEHKGHPGIERHFMLSGDLPEKTYLLTEEDAGAKYSSSAGAWEAGRLTLSKSEAGKFTITMMERPNQEPIGYWSMNDVMARGVGLRQDGAIGRAWKFSKNASVRTEINTDELKAGATFCAWIQAGGNSAQPVFGARSKDATFDLTYEGKTKTLKLSNQLGESTESATGKTKEALPWTHLAATLNSGEIKLYINGKQAGGSVSKGLLVNSAALVIGSQAKENPINASLDEARVYSRVLSQSELLKLFQQAKSR
jgi:uncharacterized cupredoxin-like copper-binding protein